MSDNYITCERCKVKKALFVCNQCNPLHNFCSQCDSSVHSLPSKRNHRRESLESEIINEKFNEKINTNVNIIPTEAEFQGKITFSNSKTNQVTINPYAQPFTQSGSTNLSTFEDKKYMSSYNRTYTREYVNELKSIYDKEKEELIFKYNSLQNAFERLKINLMEQIQKLQIENEVHKNKNTHSRKILEEQGNIKLLALENEKDIMIKNLERQIEEYQNCNEELLDKLQNHIKENKNNKEKNKNQIQDLTKIVEVREREMEEIKNKYDNRINTIVSENEIDKKDVNKQFEFSMNRMSIEHAKEKEKLDKLLEEREKELMDVLDKKRDDQRYYEMNINELKMENENLKKKIENCILFF